MTAAQATGGVDRVARLCWCRIPATLGRASRALAFLSLDGSYVLGWPLVAALAPPALFVAAVVLGATHPLATNDLYSSSLLLLVALALPGQFGAGFGMWTVTGYALGDFALNRRSALPEILRCNGCGPLEDLVRIREPMVLSYVLLAALLVAAPFIARALARQTSRPLERFIQPVVIPRVVGQAALQALLVLLWTMVFPPLIRPYFTWATGGDPELDAIRFVQQDGWVLVVLGALGGAGRVLLERRTAERPDAIAAVHACRMMVSRALHHRTLRLPLWITAPLLGAGLTLLLAGILDGWLQAGLLFAAFTASMVLRHAAARVPAWAGLMGRVPILGRLVAGGLASYLIAGVVLDIMALEQSFLPVVVACALSMPVMAILLPARAASGAGPREVQA